MSQRDPVCHPRLVALAVSMLALAALAVSMLAPRGGEIAAPSEIAAPPPEIAAPPPEIAAPWRPLDLVDAFSDSVRTVAASAAVRSLRPMRSPYGDTTARITVDCTGVVGILFSRAPNLTGGEIQSGFNVYSVPVRVDGEDVGRWDVLQAWGSVLVAFVDRGKAIVAIAAGNTFTVSLPWYGSPTAFSWSLEGSSELIRASCD